jgi:hypothetical protein
MSADFKDLSLALILLFVAPVMRTLAWPLILLLGSALSASRVNAEDALHEGKSAAVGASTTGRAFVAADADFTLPWTDSNGIWDHASHAGLKLGGPHLGLDGARLQLLDLPHLRLLGIDRDLDAGRALGVRLGGASLPMRLAGENLARSWVIGRVGVDAGYVMTREGFGGRRDGHLAEAAVSCRLDEQVEVIDRVHVKAFQEASYAAYLGSMSGGRAVDLAHELTLKGGASLSLDVSAGAPVRKIPRTDPVTGEVTYQTRVQPGQRFKVRLLDLQGEWRPVNDISKTRQAATLQTGMEYGW